jgi:two-component system cell cycle response regulator
LSALDLSDPDHKSAGTPTLLIVDDVPDNLRLLGHLLGQQGYRVRKSLSGAAALKAAQLYPPDLILLDILMPGMDGYAVCQQLKADPHTAQVPVIFISALHQVEDKTRAFQQGGVDYITKPFEAAEVLARVRNQITLRRQQRLLEAHNQQLQSEIQHRQHIEARLQAQLIQEKLLAQMVEQIHTAPDLPPLLKGITASLQHHLQADRVVVYRTQGDGNLHHEAETCAPAVASAQEAGALLPMTEVGRSQILEPRTLTPDTPLWQYFNTLRVQAATVVPMSYGPTHAWGVLVVHHPHPTSPWQAGTLLLLQHVARQLGLAAHQHCLLAQLQQTNVHLLNQARTDPLTQLGNRRYFDEYLQQTWSARWLNGADVPVLLLVDIDFFKAYNDTYGHPAGDRCLQQVAQILRQAVRQPQDQVFRYGGEEFALVLPKTTFPGAQRVASRIQQLLADQAIPHGSSPLGDHITVSIGGVSPGNLPHQTVEAIADYVQLADKALYKAKTMGRDRTYFLPKPGPSADRGSSHP